MRLPRPDRSGLAMTWGIITPVKNTGKTGGMTAEISGNRRSPYEVQYMPGYFLALLFLRSSGIPCRMIVDNDS
jgi:hypothetical protein